ncbi:MAG: hypothetical protein AAB497_00685 [Patescibacteria group bacterium]
MNIWQTLGFSELFHQTVATLVSAFAWFPYWGPIFFGYVFWHQWMHFVQGYFMSRTNWVLLEVKVPKETFKSPLAMEIVLNALYQTSAGNWYDKMWKGKVKDYFSLEMVSIDGHIKFFIRAPALYKNVIEAQLYGQYPDVEIYEVPDYVRYVDYQGNDGDWKIIAAEYGLTKPDPYPIKTYVDYGLDKDPKEEFKIDPLTSIIEYLGSVGKGEQIWIQIIVQAAGNRYHIKAGKKEGQLGDWKDEAKDIVKSLTTKESKDKDGKMVIVSKVLEMTEGDRDVVKAIERSTGKLGFDCGVRAIYLSKKDKYNVSNLRALGGLLRPFTTNNLNGFKTVTTTFGWSYPWQDYKEMRLNAKRKKIFKAYKYRSWFHLPRKLKPFVLNTEELATIYHFPGGVAQTPTFGRIPSRKSEAPVNLPI